MESARAYILEIFKCYLNFLWKVQAEDNMICESVQRGLKSSAYDVGRYQ